ncbi:hypothetical protein DFJ43DRAFT_1044752 [Lentinula guzmanii]|uniref:Uncharacterized protein n=1 Tax=Lentinula guzmanii TaxID=2804957 RepID=A0AA38J500_9AGAR|nr:hypothetical protein DFJ43DRAFT_1044752 [Lentinula guzmanii]
MSVMDIASIGCNSTIFHSFIVSHFNHTTSLVSTSAVGHTSVQISTFVDLVTRATGEYECEASRLRAKLRSVGTVVGYTVLRKCDGTSAKLLATLPIRYLGVPVKFDN